MLHAGQLSFTPDLRFTFTLRTWPLQYWCTPHNSVCRNCLTTL